MEEAVITKNVSENFGMCNNLHYGEALLLAKSPWLHELPKLLLRIIEEQVSYEAKK